MSFNCGIECHTEFLAPVKISASFNVVVIDQFHAGQIGSLAAAFRMTGSYAEFEDCSSDEELWLYGPYEILDWVWNVRVAMLREVLDAWHWYASRVGRHLPKRRRVGWNDMTNMR